MESSASAIRIRSIDDVIEGPRVLISALSPRQLSIAIEHVEFRTNSVGLMKPTLPFPFAVLSSLMRVIILAHSGDARDVPK